MKRIVRVSQMALGNPTAAYPIPEVWYQYPVTRGMMPVMEDIHQLTFDPDKGNALIRVETTNIIYVKV